MMHSYLLLLMLFNSVIEVILFQHLEFHSELCSLILILILCF